MNGKKGIFFFPFFCKMMQAHIKLKIKCAQLPWATLSGASDVRHSTWKCLCGTRSRNSGTEVCLFVCEGVQALPSHILQAWMPELDELWLVYIIYTSVNVGWAGCGGPQSLALEERAELMWWRQLLQVVRAALWAEARRCLCHCCSTSSPQQRIWAMLTFANNRST